MELFLFGDCWSKSYEIRFEKQIKWLKVYDKFQYKVSLLVSSPSQKVPLYIICEICVRALLIIEGLREAANTKLNRGQLV